jgi:hypothetical protein
VRSRPEVNGELSEVNLRRSPHMSALGQFMSLPFDRWGLQRPHQAESGRQLA